MPGLGLGLGLNRQQQNRFQQAAQGGQGQQWLAAHPNVQARANQAQPGQASNIQNFMQTGQAGPNAAARFQPGAARSPTGQAPGAGGAPQGSGASGSQKGGGDQKAPGTQTGPTQPGMMGGQLSGPNVGQAGTTPQNTQTPQYWNQPGYQPPTGPNGQPIPGMTQGPASLGYQPGYVWNGTGYAPPGGYPPPGQGYGQLGTVLGTLGQQGSASNMANQAGGASAQSGLQAQNIQQLIQAIMGGLGGQGY